MMLFDSVNSLHHPDNARIKTDSFVLRIREDDLKVYADQGLDDPTR